MSSFLNLRAFPEGLLQRRSHWIKHWTKFTSDLLQARVTSSDRLEPADNLRDVTFVMPSPTARRTGMRTRGPLGLAHLQPPFSTASNCSRVMSFRSEIR